MTDYLSRTRMRRTVHPAPPTGPPAGRAPLPPTTPWTEPTPIGLRLSEWDGRRELEPERVFAARVTIVLDGPWYYAEGRGANRALRERSWVHPSLNEWTGRNVWAANRMKHDWAAKIARECRGLDPIRGCVVVGIRTFFGSVNRRDLDNFTPKFINDGLVSAGMIEADHSDVVRDLVPRFRIDLAHPRTEIVLVPVEADTDLDTVIVFP